MTAAWPRGSGDGLQNHVVRFDSGCRLDLGEIHMEFINGSPCGGSYSGVCGERRKSSYPSDNPIDMTFEQMSMKWSGRKKTSGPDGDAGVRGRDAED